LGEELFPLRGFFLLDIVLAHSHMISLESLSSSPVRESFSPSLEADTRFFIMRCASSYTIGRMPLDLIGPIRCLAIRRSAMVHWSRVPPCG